MTPAQIARNPFAREAELLRRIEKQQRIETILFRGALIALAIVGTWIIWAKDSYAGWQALPSDLFMIGVYLGVIAIKLRDDIRQG